MKTNVLTLIITLVVGVILAGSLLVPVIDANKLKETENQEEGSFTYFATDKIGVGTYTVADSNLSLNGELIGDRSANILSDKFRVIFYNGGLSFHDETSASNEIPIKSMTINADGSYSYVSTSDVETTASDKIGWFMGVAPTGNYVMGYETYTLEINSDSVIYATTVNTISDGTDSYNPGTYIINAKGTKDNLDVSAGYTWQSGAWTDSDVTVTLPTLTESSEGVYTIDGNTRATLNLEGNDNSVDLLIFVPYNYYIISDGPANSLLGVIPILMIVGLVVVAIGAIILRRD